MSTPSQSFLIKLAKQGNPKAIAALMNRQLQPKGLTVKVVIQHDWLQVNLETKQPQERKALVEFICKGVTGLEIESLKGIKVCCRQVGEDFSVWSERITLKSPVSSTKPVAIDKTARIDKIANQIDEVLKDEFYYKDFIYNASNLCPRNSQHEIDESWKQIHQNAINNLSRFLVSRLRQEKLLDIFGVRYKGENSYLIVTTQKVLCLSAIFGLNYDPRKNPIKFCLPLNNICEMIIAKNGMSWSVGDVEYKLYFNTFHTQNPYKNLYSLGIFKREAVIPNDEYEKSNLITGFGCLSVLVVLIVWGFSSCVSSLLNPPQPVTQSQAAQSQPSSASQTTTSSSTSSCPCSQGCVYVTSNEWAAMSGEDRRAYKQAVRALTGKCTIVIGS